MGSGRTRRVAGALIAGALALAVVPSAQAKTTRTSYPGAGTRLVTNPADWSSDTASEGLCVQALLCPTVTNKLSTSGGPNGGFLDTSIGSLTGVGATSIGTWTSKPFAYKGAGGLLAKRLQVKIYRRTDDKAFLAVAGNSATFTVNVLDAHSGNAVAEPWRNVNLTPTKHWTKLGPQDLRPRSLVRGRSYQIEIVTTFSNGAQVVPGASADYSNVRVLAARHRKRKTHNPHLH
jgi:hypothetical protein